MDTLAQNNFLNFWAPLAVGLAKNINNNINKLSGIGGDGANSFPNCFDYGLGCLLQGTSNVTPTPWSKVDGWPNGTSSDFSET
jgi:hypothetical protein